MILNLHGIDGKAYNTNYRVLSSLVDKSEIYSPQIDYRSRSHNVVYHEVTSFIDHMQNHDKLRFIVGNSYGGFLAICIAHMYKIPCILTNPCLRPDLSIESVIPKFLNGINGEQIHFWVQKLTNDKSIFNNTHIILGDADEVLDSNLSRNFAKGADIVTIQGNHKLSGENFEQNFITMVNEILIN